jgi:putative flippase GtrA
VPIEQPLPREERLATPQGDPTIDDDPDLSLFASGLLERSRPGPRTHSVARGPDLSSQRRARIARLARYATTSVVAFGVSEVALLVLYGSGTVNATLAALIANLVGTVPSYLMSRYWIWSEAARNRVGRQMVLYWALSIACIAGTSLSTGAIASLVPAGHRFHLAIAGIGFLAVSVIFWLAKFVIYQRFIFPVAGNEMTGAKSPGTATP